MRVLLTGMSGTGKSALVQELRRRGHAAYDADDGFSEPRAGGRWGWRADLVAELLASAPNRLLFFAGCAEEQIELPFDYRVLLTAPTSVLVQRLRTRTGNSYGRDAHELAQVLADQADVEPLLRRSADLVLTTTAPQRQLADVVLRRIAELEPGIVGRSAGGADARSRRSPQLPPRSPERATTSRPRAVVRSPSRSAAPPGATSGASQRPLGDAPTR